MQVPFVKKTVAGVLAGFQKTVNDLRDIAAARADEVVKIDGQVRTLRAESDAAGSEGLKAAAIADKLDRLISG